MYNILPIISKQNLEYIVVLLTGGIGYSQYALQENLTSTFMYVLAMDPVLMFTVWNKYTRFHGVIHFHDVIGIIINVHIRCMHMVCYGSAIIFTSYFNEGTMKHFFFFWYVVDLMRTLLGCRQSVDKVMNSFICWLWQEEIVY